MSNFALTTIPWTSAAGSGRQTSIDALNLVFSDISAAIDALGGPVSFDTVSASFETIAAAQVATIDAAAKAVILKARSAPGDRGGGVFYRVASEPSHSGKFRSTDRVMPDGSTDATNGGWWALLPSALVKPETLGAAANGSTDDSASLIACFDLSGSLRLSASRYAIAATVSTPTPGFAGGRISGAGGVGGTIQTGAARNALTRSGLVWAGADGGTMVSLDYALSVQLEDFTLAGRAANGSGDRAAIGVLVPGTAGGFGTGLHRFERVRVEDCAVGVQFGTAQGDGNAADTTFVNVNFEDCDVGVRVKNDQGVNYRFDTLHANYCTRVLHCERGGNVHADMVQLVGCGGAGADDWCFDFGALDDGNYANTIRGLRWEQNTQKIARILQNGTLVIDGFTEAQVDQNAEMFRVQGGQLVLRNGRLVTSDATTPAIAVGNSTSESVIRFENVYFDVTAFNIGDWINFLTQTYHRTHVIFRGCTYGAARQRIPDMSNALEHGPVIVRRQTTDATANVKLTFDGAAPSRANTVFLQPGTIWAVEAQIVGWDDTGAVAFTGRRAATLRCTGAGASSQLNVQTIGTDYNPGTFGGCTIDRGSGSGWPTLDINVTGKAATTIDWRATVTGVQVGVA